MANSRKLAITGGYPVKYASSHPSAGASGYVYKHVLVAERAIGHRLPEGAEIHHVNEDIADFRNSNLVICQDKAYHKLLHARARVVKVGGNPNTEAICSRCHHIKPKTSFNRRNRNKSTGVQHHCRECSMATRRALRATTRLLGEVA